MVDKDKKDRDAADETERKSKGPEKDDADEDEGELSPITPKTGEPADNLRRREEWFQKRHGRG